MGASACCGFAPSRNADRTIYIRSDYIRSEPVTISKSVLLTSPVDLQPSTYRVVSAPSYGGARHSQCAAFQLPLGAAARRRLLRPDSPGAEVPRPSDFGSAVRRLQIPTASSVVQGLEPAPEHGKRTGGPRFSRRTGSA